MALRWDLLLLRPTFSELTSNEERMGRERAGAALWRDLLRMRSGADRTSPHRLNEGSSDIAPGLTFSETYF